MDVATIVTSAAVGALVSSVVTFAGAFLERREKRKELVFTRAIELAKSRRELAFRLADKNNVRVDLPNEILAVAGYVKVLHHLLDHQVLPKDWVDTLEPGDPRLGEPAEPKAKPRK